jgi:hypothetical protein
MFADHLLYVYLRNKVIAIIVLRCVLFSSISEYTNMLLGVDTIFSLKIEKLGDVNRSTLFWNRVDQFSISLKYLFNFVLFSSFINSVPLDFCRV